MADQRNALATGSARAGERGTNRPRRIRSTAANEGARRMVPLAARRPLVSRGLDWLLRAEVPGAPACVEAAGARKISVTQSVAPAFTTPTPTWRIAGSRMLARWPLDAMNAAWTVPTVAPTPTFSESERKQQMPDRLECWSEVRLAIVAE